MNQSAELLRPAAGGAEGGPSRAHLTSVIILKLNECGRTPGPVRNGTARLRRGVSIGDR